MDHRGIPYQWQAIAIDFMRVGSDLSQNHTATKKDQIE